MENYKLTIALKPDLSAEQSKKAGEKVESAVRKAGGKVVKAESLGLKPLAYPIENFEQASFGQFLLELPKNGVVGLRRELERGGSFLRVMVVKAIGT